VSPERVAPATGPAGSAVDRVGASGAGSRAAVHPRGLRVLAVHVPDLPLQRIRRSLGDPPGRRAIAVIDQGCVVCCDAAAAGAGVRPGMTAAQALGALGRLELVQLDGSADRAALRALAEPLLGLAPAVEISPPDVLLLDASAAHLVAGLGPAEAGTEPAERALAARALEVVAEMGYSARAAVAEGRSPARAIARHLPGSEIRWTAVGATRQALAPLPVAALGLAPAVAVRLRELGIVDAGGLARLPDGTLAHRFGPDGVAAARLARGEDASPLVPYAPATLPEEAAELEAPAEGAEPLLFVLKRLADRVAARLAGRGLGATRLKLVLKLDPRGEERLAVALAQPTAAAARWLLPLREHLFSLRLPAAVAGLRLAAVEAAPIAAEQLAFGDRPAAVAALEAVLERLSVRLGEEALFAAEPVERYRPECAYRAVPFAPGPKRERPEKEVPEEAAHRPTRLLARPEPVVAVGEGGGRLTALRVGGKDRAVRSYRGPERLSGEWWSERFDRDYYRVELEELGECWIYRDGADGRLYLHGFFD